MAEYVQHRLNDLVRRQHGVVTRPQLLELGFTAGGIRHRLTSGRFNRLHQGVYVVGPIIPRHAREMAAVLACGPEALLGDRSAAVLWDLVPPPADPSVPVDVVRIGGSSRDRPGIRVRRVRCLEAADRAERDGIPVTSPARTLLDLAAVVGGRDLERAIARAERERLVERDQLEDLVARHGGRRGAPALRAVLERAGGPALTRSEAEVRFLRLVRKARLPPPKTNARVGGYELDFLWREHGIAVEVDGYAFHSSRPRFEGDRRRAADLASRGIQVIPLTWKQIVEEGTATAVQVAQALLQAKLRGAARRK